MAEFRIRYTMEGHASRRELIFKPEAGQATPREVAIAIMKLEFPDLLFPNGLAEDVLRKYGISDIKSPDILPMEYEIPKTLE